MISDRPDTAANELPAAPLDSRSIAALQPDGPGHQFVVYADCCSGIPGAKSERTFAAVNAVLKRLDPQPEFVLFPGDEIRGLVPDPAVLRDQWRYWFDVEMEWLDREAIPLYHTTANHTVYDPQSEAIFREVMAHLPANGPAEQIGLSYFVRRGDLLLVFVNTLWSGLGGEGRVETDWLDATLAAHADATHKLVIGHHPVFPTNGFAGEWQREIDHLDGQRLWEVLVRHGVLVYLCSHMLAFDVQVHQGVLQILTAGAGTEPGMPESEYRHLVQAALDADGLRYQVLDVAGTVRELLVWPLRMAESSTWQPWNEPETIPPSKPGLVCWRFAGESMDDDRGEPQTLLSGWNDDGGIDALWIGLRSPEQRLCVLMSRASGRSPHLWTGPTLEKGRAFDVQVAIHTGMGPGGMLWRWDDAAEWSSMNSCSSWGAEELKWPVRWSVGHDRDDTDSQPFRGSGLEVARAIERFSPSHLSKLRRE